jgi:hypothetical protein
MRYAKIPNRNGLVSLFRFKYLASKNTFRAGARRRRKMSRGNLDYELRREKLRNSQSARKGLERDEALRRAAGWSLLLVVTVGFIFALGYHPARRVSGRAARAVRDE